MKPHGEIPAPPITLRAHPPERRRRPLAAPFDQGYAFAGCTSCCCCCLHSLGGLAGAAVGSFYPRDPPAPGGTPAPPKLVDDEIDASAREIPAKPPINSIYWSATLVVAVLVTLVAMAKQGLGGIWLALSILALFLPAVQLGGSLLCALVLAYAPGLRQEPRAWRRLGWITVGTVAGCLVGILIMWVVFAGGFV